MKKIIKTRTDNQLAEIEKRLNRILKRKYKQFEKLSVIPNIATIVKSDKKSEIYTNLEKEYRITNQDFEMSFLITDKTMIIGKIRKWKDERFLLATDIKTENNSLWTINQDTIKKMELLTEIITYKYFEFQEKLVSSSLIPEKSTVFQLRKKPAITLYRCIHGQEKIKGILIASDMRCNVGNIKT